VNFWLFYLSPFGLMLKCQPSHITGRTALVPYNLIFHACTNIRTPILFTNKTKKSICLTDYTSIIWRRWRFLPLKLVYPRNLSLKCLYQAMIVSGYEFVCKGYQFYLFLWFSYWLLELFQLCSIFKILFNVTTLIYVIY
jgi:hypothetical protein